MKRFLLPVVIGALIIAFWLKPEVQEIAAGVAIFLFGMLMLEDGFKLFGGGLLERMLERATNSLPKSLLFGIVSTTLLQSSSLVSVIAISFLSAGLISLVGGIGVIFGANIGTTTGAWLVAGFGLKVNIASYAMPMIALSIILVFQKSKHVRGIGYALGGLGFLFLGIHHMKEGFEAFKDQIDLTQFALPGIRGLIVYTLLGTVATVVMQSSHATMVLIITAVATGQITYENSLALAIGANIGTTVTAIIGSLSANYQGKRLALAHFIFNVTTAAVAILFIGQLKDMVDWVSARAGIAPDDYALKLAVFHTIFNVLGVLLLLPAIGRIVSFIQRVIAEPVPDVSRPRFLNEAIDEFPQTLELAMRNEVFHLYENAEALILHGLNLHRDELVDAPSIADVVQSSRTETNIDFEQEYERRIKMLYAAIVDYASRAENRRYDSEITNRIYALRDVSTDIVQAVKSVKHLRKNILRYTVREQGTVTNLYDDLRAELARILVEIRKMDAIDPDMRSSLWFDQERAQIRENARTKSRRIDTLIRTGDLNALAATSFLNDSGYAYDAMRSLINAAKSYYYDRDSAMAEVERLVSLEDEELVDESGARTDIPSAAATNQARHGQGVETPANLQLKETT